MSARRPYWSLCFRRCSGCFPTLLSDLGNLAFVSFGFRLRLCFPFRCARSRALWAECLLSAEGNEELRLDSTSSFLEGPVICRGCCQVKAESRKCLCFCFCTALLHDMLVIAHGSVFESFVSLCCRLHFVAIHSICHKYWWKNGTSAGEKFVTPQKSSLSVPPENYILPLDARTDTRTHALNAQRFLFNLPIDKTCGFYDH